MYVNINKIVQDMRNRKKSGNAKHEGDGERILEMVRTRDEPWDLSK